MTAQIPKESLSYLYLLVQAKKKRHFYSIVTIILFRKGFFKIDREVKRVQETCKKRKKKNNLQVKYARFKSAFLHKTCRKVS